MQEASKKQYCARRKTPFAVMHKQVHDKRSIAESQHAYINRTTLTACEVGIFSHHNSRKYTHPLFEEPLKFITHERIFKRLRYCSRVGRSERNAIVDHFSVHSYIAVPLQLVLCSQVDKVITLAPQLPRNQVTGMEQKFPIATPMVY